jgi:hypothetical protein
MLIFSIAMALGYGWLTDKKAAHAIDGNSLYAHIPVGPASGQCWRAEFCGVSTRKS